MLEEEKKKIISQSWISHELIERSYLINPAKKGDVEWLEKQRILLADMALHLLQTALNPGEIDTDKLKNNIHSILTISDQFLPDAELDKAKKNYFVKKYHQK